MVDKSLNVNLTATNKAAGAFRSFEGNVKRTGAAVREADSHVVKYRREMERLRDKFDPAAAAAARMEQRQRDLSRAWNMGAISQRAYQAELARTRQQTDLAGVANARFSEALGGSSWKRQVQQAGMQVSDFAVQVAGGQSAILAFTQNAPQFIQNFGAIGGVVAAGVTILGTFAYMASRSAGSVLEFSKQIERTTEDLDEYFTLLRSSGGNEAAMFKRAEESLKLTSQAVKDLMAIAKIEAYKSVNNLSDSLVKSVTGASYLKTELQDIGAVINASAAEIISANMGGGAGEQVRQLRDSLYELRDANTIDEMYESTVRLRDIFKANVDVTKEMSDGQIEFWKQLSQTIEQLELLGAAEEAVANTAAQHSEEWLSAGRGRVLALQQELDLMRVRAEHGSESLAYAREQQRVDLENLRVKLEQEAAVDGVTDAERKLIDEIIAAQEESNKFQRSLLAGKEIADQVRGAIEGINFDGAIRGANALVARLGKAWQIATDLAKKQAQNVRKGPLTFGGSVPTSGSKTDVMFGRTGDVDFTNRPPDWLEKWGSGWDDIATGGGGKKGGAGKKTELEKQADQLKDYMKKSSDAFREYMGNTKNMSLETVKRIGDSFMDMEKTISQSMMGNFKALLDGSKSFAEAAYDLLGNIANKLLDIALTPMFNRFAGGLTGGIFGGGFGALMGFEGGGTTGAGVRAGGIDGKGGKLAMVHPNESIHDNVKGTGPSGGVTVNQYITTPNADSFKRSSRQIARQAKMAMG